MNECWYYLLIQWVLFILDYHSMLGDIGVKENNKKVIVTETSTEWWQWQSRNARDIVKADDLTNLGSKEEGEIQDNPSSWAWSTGKTAMLTGVLGKVGWESGFVMGRWLFFKLLKLKVPMGHPGREPRKPVWEWSLGKKSKTMIWDYLHGSVWHPEIV